MHDPYTPPEPYKTKYASNPYDGEIAYVDEYVGKLLSKVQDLHLQDNTLIFVTGDHGEAFGQAHEVVSHNQYAAQAWMSWPSGMS